MNTAAPVHKALLEKSSLHRRRGPRESLAAFYGGKRTAAAGSRANVLHTFAYASSWGACPFEEDDNEDEDRRRRRRFQSLPALYIRNFSYISADAQYRSSLRRQLSSYTTATSSWPMRERQRKLHQLVPSSDYHASASSEKAVAIVLSLGAVSAVAYAASMAVRAYNDYREWQNAPTPTEEFGASSSSSSTDDASQAESRRGKEQSREEGQKRENVFARWLGADVNAKYYEGGFEDKMTRKEAALILGVRETSSARRIKDAHRRLLVLNHPDTGGSTYLAGKLNEAKELLLKGKSDK